MSDRTPEHRRTAPGQLGANTDPSNPGTCETPLPVSYVEGGEKIAPRASQGVETCPSCGALGYGNATCRTCHAKWVEAWGHQCDCWDREPHGVPEALKPASERPNAGAETANVPHWLGEVFADESVGVWLSPSLGELWWRNGSGFYAGTKLVGDQVRANLPADAKRVVTSSGADAAARRAASWWEAAKVWCRVARERHEMFRQHVNLVDGAHRQIREAQDRADAAEAKLAKLSESGVEGWAIRCGEMAKLANRRERERDEARAKLAEIAAALAVADNDKAVPYEYLTDTVRAVLRDGTPPAEPVTDREEPAQAMDGPPWADGRFQSCHVEPGTTYPDEPSVEIPQGWWVLNDAEDCAWHAEIHVAEASDPDGNDARQRIAQLIVDTLNVRGPASEEPVGETKPRTLLGWVVPDHVQMIENTEGVRLICAQDHTGVLASSSIAGDARALAFLQAHAHGQPVERQADSETQR